MLNYLLIRLYFVYDYLIVRFPEYDVKKIEAYRSISGLYVEVCVLILVLLFALSIKLLNNERI